MSEPSSEAESVGTAADQSIECVCRDAFGNQAGSEERARVLFGRLGDMGWHPDDDSGDETVTERFERFPILLQRALVRLAYTVIDSSPSETDEGDAIIGFMCKDDSPTPEASRRQLRAFQEVRMSVAAQIVINRFGLLDVPGEHL